MTGRYPNIPATILSRITKVFITNLPDKCSGKDLSEFIREFGVIYDIYIARKRDKFGNRFGFVSFLDVKDTNDVLRKIRNTCIGDCWLKANIARFTLEEGEIRPDQEQKINNPNIEDGGRKTDKPPTSFYNGNRSFTDTLLGRQGGMKSGKSVIVEDNENALSGIHGRALVARMIDLDALKNIYIILHEICPGQGKVQFIGGLSVLITFEDNKTASWVHEATKEVLGRFSSVDLWEGQTFAFERLAWIKIVGVPLHLLSSQVIKAVRNSVGKIVHSPNRSDEDDDLSYDYMGIIAGDGKRIVEEITVVWKDKTFSVWVTEEAGDWVPEFYKVPTSDSINDDSHVNVETPMHAANNVDEQMEVTPGRNEAENPEDGASGLETTYGINDGNDGNIIANDCEIVTPLILENITDNQEFIPGKDFDFEAICNLDGSLVDIGPNINKRKKKGFLGPTDPINPAYSSSLEKAKVGKKNRVQDDIFGLDSLLGLDKETGPVVSPPLEQNELVINSHPLCDQEHDQFSDLDRYNVNGASSIVQGSEVEATIVMGEILGADLSNSHGLIQESIVKEGYVYKG